MAPMSDRLLTLILGLAACAWMVAITALHYYAFYHASLGNVLDTFWTLWGGY